MFTLSIYYDFDDVEDVVIAKSLSHLIISLSKLMLRSFVKKTFIDWFPYRNAADKMENPLHLHKRNLRM